MDNEQQDIASEVDSQFGAGFADVDPRPFSLQFPRGTYSFEITNAYLSRSASGSNRKQLVAVTNIFEASTGDEFVGKTYTKTWGLEDEQNLEWLKRDMIALDIEPPKTGKDLLAIAQKLIGIRFTGQLVPNRDEQYPANLFLNRGAKVEVPAGSEAKTKARF